VGGAAASGVAAVGAAAAAAGAAAEAAWATEAAYSRMADKLIELLEEAPVYAATA